MKTRILLSLSLFANLIFAQTTATFENFNLGVDTFLNGNDLQGGFSDGNVFLSNTYDTGFNSWFGFSISSMTDVTTPGWTNEFSCISGSGYDNSNTYAIAYMSYLTNNTVMSLENNASGKALEGMYVNNSTYAYLSMRDGDSAAKKFGGVTGNDPDYFLLTITKFLNGVEGTEKIEFYLADFRFSDNNQDYIVDEWTYIDLSSLGNADSIAFSLSSSDVGQFGMNTPAYFCLDNITTKDELATGIQTSLEDLALSFFPNPVTEVLNIKNESLKKALIVLRNSVGQEVYTKRLESASEQLDLSSLSHGVYSIQFIFDDGSIAMDQFLKK